MTSQAPKRQQLNKLITEQFIALWQQERSLWDPTSPLYRSKRAKQESLQVFKEQLDFEEHEVRTKINTLRSYFIAEMKKIQRNPNYELKWTHYDSLMFLKDTINARKRSKEGEEDGGVEDTYGEYYPDDDKTVILSAIDETELPLVTMCSDDELMNKENRTIRHSPDTKKRKVVNGSTDAADEPILDEPNSPSLELATMIPVSIAANASETITSRTTSSPSFTEPISQPPRTFTHEKTRSKSSSSKNKSSSNTPLVVLSRIATRRSNERKSLPNTKRPMSNNTTRSTSKRSPFLSPKITSAASKRQTLINNQLKNTAIFTKPVSSPVAPTSTTQLAADGDELFGLSIGQSLKSISDTRTKEYIKYKMQELIYKAHYGLIDQPENDTA